MAGSDLLNLIAQLSVGFAGFVSIFFIFARGDGTFSPADSVRVTATIWASFAALFLSLIPLVLMLSNITEAAIWRTASLIFLVALVAIDIHVWRLQFSLEKEEQARIGRMNNIFAWGATAILVVLLGSNIFGAFGGPGALQYVAAIVILLGIATSNFVTIAAQKLLSSNDST